MHKLYELKDMLCKELEEYGSKEMTAGSLDVIDKLAHSIKNIDKILEEDDTDASYRYSMREEPSRRSYARGRMRARRDSMGRYSRDGYSGEFKADLEELMESAPNEQVKRKIRDLMNEM